MRGREEGPSAASSVLSAPAMLVHSVSKGFGLAKELAWGNFPSESPPYTSPSLLTYLSLSVFGLFLRQ